MGKFKLTLLFLMLPLFLFSSNYTSLLEKQSMESRDPNLIRFKIANFSTRKGPPSFKSLHLDGRVYKRGATGTYLVQFTGAIRSSWRNEIKKMGGEIFGYVPNHADIVRINSSKISEIEKLPYVQWVGRYKPAYRISPKLLHPERADLDGTIMLKIRLYKGADRNGIADQLRTLGAKILRNEKGMYYDYIRIRVPADKAQDIATYAANLENVSWVERYYKHVLDVAWTRWIIQSYYTSDMGSATAGWDAALTVDATHTPIYYHGIFGQGQIVGDADTGSDWDNMWMYETSGDMNFNGSGTTFSGTPGHKFVGYQTLGDNHDGASNNETSSGGTSGHGTHTSTTIVGDSAWHDPSSDGVLARGDGIAPLARIAFQDISTTPSSGGEALDGLPSDLNNLFLWAYNAGARIHSDSWGSSTHSYDTDAQECDQFMWNHKDFLILVAMGNSGPDSGTIGSPSTAKDIVSVGASQSGAGCDVAATGQASTKWQNPGDPEDRYGTGWNADGIPDDDIETMGWFSSHGPTDEGLRKPEVVTPGGHMIFAGWSTGSTSDGPTADPSSPNTGASSNGTYLCQMGGTSMATPAAAGAAVLIRQYYMDGFYPSGTKNSSDALTPSAALMKATLIASTRNMTGYYTTLNGSSSAKANVPTNGQGWGRVVLDDALYFSGDARKLKVYDNTTGLSTGQSQQYTIQTGSNTSEDFKVVLVWTDYPGTPGASDVLVNDLNLTVSDGSNTYKGSVFGSDGYSTTGGSYDATNANEVVWIKGTNAANKTYTITVNGNNVNQGPQPYALVICGDLGSDTIKVGFDRDSVKVVYPVGSAKGSKNGNISIESRIVKSNNVSYNILKKGKKGIKYVDLGNMKPISNYSRVAGTGDTLKYYKVDANGTAYLWKDPDEYRDSTYVTKFTANYDNDTLGEFWFYPYSAINGPFNIRIDVWDIGSDGYPNNIVAASSAISTDSLTMNQWNGFDIRAFNLVYNKNDSFFVGIENLGDPSQDTLEILSDTSYVGYPPRSYELYNNNWEIIADTTRWGANINFIYETILFYSTTPAAPTDTATFYVKNDPTSNANLIINSATDAKDTCWIDSVLTPVTSIAPGDSAPVNIVIDTVGLPDGIYYSWIVVNTNATDTISSVKSYRSASSDSMPILLDYYSGQHAGISVLTGKKAIKKLNLITKKNPFTENTAIEFALPNKARVTLSIYDISGKKVNTLVDKEYNSGRYIAKWNGRDSNGKRLPGGFYFARIKAGNKSMVTKIVKLR